MRSEHTEVPPPVERNSGSRVRLPVRITRLMLVPAIAHGSFPETLKLATESMPGSGGNPSPQRKMVGNVAGRARIRPTPSQRRDKARLVSAALGLGGRLLEPLGPLGALRTLEPLRA